MHVVLEALIDVGVATNGLNYAKQMSHASCVKQRETEREERDKRNQIANDF